MTGIAAPPPVTAEQLAAVAQRIPGVPKTLPVPEARAPQIGDPTTYAAEDHTHPWLTSVTIGTLGADGLSGNLAFTRTFDKQPGVLLTPVMPGGTQPVALQVQSWIKDAAGLYTGCTVKGYRGQVLPNTLTVLSGLAAFDVHAGTAAGVQFSLIAIQAS